MKKLNLSEIRALSSICTNFSAVFLASLIVPVFSGNFDVSAWSMILLGMGLTIGSVALALYCAKKGKI